MRILHLDIDDLSSPLGGGQARRTYEINRRLAAQGHQVTVVTGRYGRAVRGSVVRDGVVYRRLGGGPFPWNFLTYLALLGIAVRAEAHDLLVEDFTSPVSTGMSPLYTRRPVIASVANLFAEPMAEKYGLPFDLVEHLGLRLYRHFIALTPGFAARLRARQPGANVAVIPQGLNDEDFVPLAALDASGRHFLYMGRLDIHQKGLDTLLVAYASMPAAKRAPLVIAGTGSGTARLREMVASLGLVADVQLPGQVTGPAKRALLADAMLLCMPSRYEVLPIVALEALAAGLPIIASDIPGLGELIAATAGVLVRPDLPGEWATAMGDLSDDRRHRRQLAQAGREAVAGLTWDLIADRQEAVYQGVGL